MKVTIILASHIYFTPVFLNLSLKSSSSFVYPSVFCPKALRRQDGGLFKSTPYPGYPFLMIPDLTNPYLSNGALSPSARTVSCSGSLLPKLHTVQFNCAYVSPLHQRLKNTCRYFFEKKQAMRSLTAMFISSGLSRTSQ